MSETANYPRKIPFSARVFGLGLGVAGVVYLILGGYLAMNGHETAMKRQKSTASQTVAIQREASEMKAPPHEMFGPPVPAPHETVPVEESSHTEAPEPSHDEHPAPESEDVSGTALTNAPVDGLYEDTADGRLPKIRDTDRLTPFDAYRRPFKTASAVSAISIVVMDIGISDNGTQAALNDLPPDISLAINPYAQNPDFWSNEARVKGHEIWVELPVESDLYPMDDPGPQTLLIGAIEKQNLNKLNWTLSRTVGYAGIVTGYQPALMKSDTDARPVLRALYSRGLGFVDGESQPTDFSATLAAEMNGPYAHNNIWIDTPATAEHIALSLRQLEVLAQGNGSSIGFIHPSPISLTMIQDWIKTLPEKNIVLAPLSVQAGTKK